MSKNQTTRKAAEPKGRGIHRCARDVDRALGMVTYSSNCRVAFGVDGPVLPDQCWFVTLPRREGSFLVACSDATVKHPQVASGFPGSVIHAAASGIAAVEDLLAQNPEST